MAYKSKYYDPVKAHEYYIKHRKLKGKTSRSSTASLNENGKVAAAEVKERLNEELKAALAKLPRRGASAQRKALREKYKEMYLQELDKIKQDSSFGKAPKAKATKASTSSGRSRGGSGSASRSAGTVVSTKAESNNQSKKKAKKAAKKSPSYAKDLEEVRRLITELEGKISEMPAEKKRVLKSKLQKITYTIMPSTGEKNNE